MLYFKILKLIFKSSKKFILTKYFLSCALFVFSTIVFILVFKFYNEIYLECYSRLYVYKDALFNEKETRDFNENELVFTSKCDCKNNEQIRLFKINDHFYSISSVLKNTNAKIPKYNVSKLKFESSIFSCDMYNSLRRGPNQKVISYSLYGKNTFYYKSIKSLANIIKKRYPNWIIRVHHDNSIDKSVICEIECLKFNSTETNGEEYLDIIDFCNIEELPFDFERSWNASFMHGMSWRWLPIGDSFIDYWNSRDTDSWIPQRELDSVNVWLNSNTLFHVMRGKPY